MAQLSVIGRLHGIQRVSLIHELGTNKCPLEAVGRHHRGAALAPPGSTCFYSAPPYLGPGVGFFDERLGKAVLGLGKDALVAALEPRKSTFRVRPGQVGAITKLLRGLGHDEIKSFASPKGRDSFLWAAANYLAPLPHEELIVAFGDRRGSRRTAGAALRRVHRSVGERDRVSLSANLSSLLEMELQRDGAEIVLVHNHPAHPLKSAIGAVLGWRPIASTQDRRLATAFAATRLAHTIASPRPSSFKWYLVDEGEVGEFILPPLDVLLAWLASESTEGSHRP